MLADVSQWMAEARSSFFKAAFREVPHDPAIHQVIRPEPLAEAVARTAPIGGRDQYADLKAAVDAAEQSLRVLAAANGSPEQFGAWQEGQRTRLLALVRRMLSDAQIALTEAISHIRVKPELR